MVVTNLLVLFVGHGELSSETFRSVVGLLSFIKCLLIFKKKMPSNMLGAGVGGIAQYLAHIMIFLVLEEQTF